MGNHYTCSYCGTDFCDEKDCTPEAKKNYDDGLKRRTKELEDRRELFKRAGVYFYETKDHYSDDLPTIHFGPSEMEKLAKKYVRLKGKKTA